MRCRELLAVAVFQLLLPAGDSDVSRLQVYKWYRSATDGKVVSSGAVYFGVLSDSLSRLRVVCQTGVVGYQSVRQNAKIPYQKPLNQDARARGIGASPS